MFLNSFFNNIALASKKTYSDFHAFLLFFDIYQNDYLNPYTMTFKNPKTIQMFNIMVLYHYVMTFIVGIVVFTFIFIFLSMYRHHFYFHIKVNQDTSDWQYSLRSIYWLWKRDKKDLPYLWYLLHSWFNAVVAYYRSEKLEAYKRDVEFCWRNQISHAPWLEFVWVWIPALILVAIAYPSVLMLYFNESYVDPSMSVTIIGNQWYWTYEYNDYNLIELFKKHINSQHSTITKALNNCVSKVIRLEKLTFKKFKSSTEQLLWDTDAKLCEEIPLKYSVDCNMIIAKNPRLPRLLTTDQCLVIPSHTTIRFLVTSSDVIHSWAVPSYGVKMDAIPGRINQLIFSVPLMGTSWGQCSELCGVNHAFMPIEIKVLAFPDFLYFMQLRIREILKPFLTTYYEVRLEILKNWFASDKFLYAVGRKSHGEALRKIKNFMETSGFNKLVYLDSVDLFSLLKKPLKTKDQNDEKNED